MFWSLAFHFERLKAYNSVGVNDSWFEFVAVKGCTWCKMILTFLKEKINDFILHQDPPVKWPHSIKPRRRRRRRKRRRNKRRRRRRRRRRIWKLDIQHLIFRIPFFPFRIFVLFGIFLKFKLSTCLHFWKLI